MNVFLRLLGLLLVAGFATRAQAAGAGYDPMADLVSTAKKEIAAARAIESSKRRVTDDPRYQKMKKGYWQFFQGKPDAKPGEACTAVFWKDSQMISLIGPGGGYRGALLNFVSVESKTGFPYPDDPQQVRKLRVSLQQGDGAPATVTAFNRTIAPRADELSFAVPTIDAALATMEDRLRFRIQYEGREVFDLTWHSGHAARDVLRRCVNGERVDGQEVL